MKKQISEMREDYCYAFNGIWIVRDGMILRASSSTDAPEENDLVDAGFARATPRAFRRLDLAIADAIFRLFNFPIRNYGCEVVIR